MKLRITNFEISLVVFMPNITSNHAITYTNTVLYFSAQCTSVILQVEKRLKELEKASNTADLLNSFKNLGNDLMDLAKLSGKRQAVSPIMQ